MLPTEQNLALAMVKNLPSVRKYPEPADDEFLINVLENSKAATEADPELFYYRVYFVGAYFLTMLPILHELEKAEEGVTFAHMYVPIRAMFALQRAKDLEMGYLSRLEWRAILASWIVAIALPLPHLDRGLGFSSLVLNQLPGRSF